MSESDRRLDEGIHLVNAFQLAGFRHVVGTLWKVSDEQCVEMVKILYKTIRDEGRRDDERGGLSVGRSRQVCIYWSWRHCLFCRDCLWREGHLYTPDAHPALLATPRRFTGDALACLTSDALLALLGLTTETRPTHNTIEDSTEALERLEVKRQATVVSRAEGLDWQ